MFGRILKKDISGNKVITATLSLFILLAAMLVSGALNIMITMLGINGASIYLGNNEDSETGSIIENSFVIQNKDFDFLLNLRA